jgi:hypothetical protein
MGESLLQFVASAKHLGTSIRWFSIFAVETQVDPAALFELVGRRQDDARAGQCPGRKATVAELLTAVSVTRSRDRIAM